MSGQLKLCLLITVNLFLFNQSFALTGVNDRLHDPSGIVKEGNTYWVYGTSYPWTKSPKANGIYTAYSTDMINWKEGKRIYDGSWPSWINTYSPTFGGNFWAPHIVFMNNKYYMYYACSEWSSTIACIGVASSPTLDQNSANYKWTDHGMVVKSSSGREIFAIDPSIFIDTDKKVYLSYGGNLGDGIVEIDPATGKIKAGKTVTRIGKGEGTAVIKQGNYYYYIQQHGSCCNGVATNYYFNCGRSTNILGPYYDENGIDLISSYGTEVLKKSGRYIGPGHFGLYRENGIDFVTYHYYDGNNNGEGTLAIGKLIFQNGWPKVTMNWLDNGQYAITGSSSLKSLQVSTNTISQNIPSTTNNAQKFTFNQSGNGLYTITASNGKSMETAGCANTNGAILQLGNPANNNCQKFMVERTPTGYYLTASYTTKLLGIISNSTLNGAQIEIRDYNGSPAQKFLINPFGTIITAMEENVESNVWQTVCYPNPFSKEITITQPGYFEYSIYNMDALLIEEGKGFDSFNAGYALLPGVYVLRVRSGSGIRVFKISKY